MNTASRRILVWNGMFPIKTLTYSENTVRAAFGLLCFYFSGAASLEVRFARFPHEYFQEGMVMQKTFFRARAAAGLVSPGAHTEGQSS